MSRLVNRVVSSRPSFPSLSSRSSASSFQFSIPSSLSRSSFQASRVFSSLSSPSCSSASSCLASSNGRYSPLSPLRVSSNLLTPASSSLLKPAFTRSYYYTPMPNPNEVMHATTILAVRKGNSTCIIGDGQVSLGPTVVKTNARKVRVIGGGKVVCGFAGSTADCFALLDRLEKKLEEHPGQLLRAAVEMAKEWRSDKYLRQLEAWMIACDASTAVTITGHGDVMSAPDDGCIAIGSGGLFAVSAARALVTVSKDHSLPLTARQIAERSMIIASEVCVYTNSNFVIEEIIDGVIQSGKDKEASKSSPTTTSTPTSSTTTTTSSTSTPTPSASSSNFSTLV